MKVKKRISQIVLVTFLLTALLPTGAWAVTTSGKSFSDVTDKHWAKQQITRMNYRGVINGYEDGTARPDQAVTEFEAISMAVRIMGLESQTSSVSAGAYLPVTVPTWKGAKETAVVAYQNGLIDEKDFKHDQGASREWIAKLLVKILKQESLLDKVAGEYLEFGDVSSISAEYLSYVKAAKSLGLIGGYTDGTFKPRNKVNRAEMAAFLSRAEDKMTSIAADNLVIGTVSGVDGINVSVKKTDGTTANFYVVPQNSALYNLSGTKISVSDLKVGDPVYVLYNGSMLNYLEIRAAAAQQLPISINLEGTITAIVSDKKAIVLTTDDDEELTTILVNDSTVITRSNVSGTLGLNNLQVGDKIKAATTNQTATQIVIVTNSNDFTQSGTIYDVDVYNKLIIMNESGGLKTYRMADDISVSIAGMLSATASSLKTGDKAAYEIKNQKMVAIAVGSNSDLYDGTGTILEINNNSRFITYKTTGGTLKANYYNNATKVSFNGETASISDLQADDVATISVSNDYITNINVTSRHLNEGYKGTIYAIDNTNSILTIKSNDGSLKTYPVASTASIMIYDSTSYFGALKKDMAVEIGISNGAITNIKANNRITGKVIRVNTSNRTLEIQPEYGSANTVYNVASNVYVRAFDTTSNTLSAVDVGDTVNMKIVNNLVTEIDVTCLIDYTVYSTYSNSSTRITVKEGNNSTLKELYINSSVKLVIPGDSTPTVRELKEGDKLIATYVGNTLEKVEVSKQIAGTISAINTATKTITLRGYDGSNYTYTFDSNSYVDINGYTYNDISQLKIGDKITINESADHGRRFATLQTLTAKVGRSQADRIFIQNSAITGDWTSYSFSSDVYLHKGNTTVRYNEFKENDVVTIYYVDRMVYEVVKQ